MFCLKVSHTGRVIPYGIGRGFDRSRAHGWYIRTNGRKEYFESEEARDAEYGQRLAEARLYGEQATAAITPGDRQLLREVQRLAGATGYTPLEIFERGLTLVGRKPRDTVKTSRAVALFLAESRARLKDGAIGSRRMSELDHILDRFGSRFASRELHAIERPDIQSHLIGLGVGPQTRINHARVISRLFAWAMQSGYITANPVVITERVKRTPAIFYAPQVRALFEKAPAEILPMLVFQWFAGIRPTATHGLRWEDINQDRRTIAIRAEISKLREPEVIEGLPEELWAWVAGHAKASGAISHSNHIDMNRRLHHAIGYGAGMKRWPEDVARHSFASHLYPRAHSIDAVAKVLCHRGSRVTLKHYVAKSVTREEAEAYFGVLAGLA